MPLYLLMINKRKWDKLNVPWLKPGQVQADPVGDLRISDGALSVWHIADDRSNLELVIVALAAARQNFDKFEYGLFDQKAIDALGIKAEVTPGNSPVEAANVWHRDLIELTTGDALNFVNTIFEGLEKHRLYDDEVQNRIFEAIRTGHIDLQKLNKSLHNKIAQLQVL